jgi:hypothetical protein
VSDYVLSSHFDRVFSWFGLLALIQSLVNPATIGPIVFFVGLQINEECLNFMPSRHYSAYIIGLFPSVYDWVTNISNRAPLSDETFTFDTNSPGASSWVGVLSWKRGSLLVSLLWVSMIVNVLDRQWATAATWAFVSSLFAVFGIIHVPQAGFSNFDSPFWEQCTESGCWEFANQWMFFVAYLMLMATFLLLYILSYYDDKMGEPIDDESRHAFDDWFADAYKYKDEDGNIRDSRDNTISSEEILGNEGNQELEHSPVVDEKEKIDATAESGSEET